MQRIENQEKTQLNQKLGFSKSNKIDIPLARLFKKKTQITKIKNERRDN